MTFQHLLDGAEVLSRSGDPSVSGVEYDSRRVKPGCVFVGMRGESSDGNRFIDQAIQAGAVAVVTDSASEKPREGVAWAVVPHGRRALARLSANFYKRPAERIAVTGITGTNGKSTTAFLVESILTAAGRKSALIGTIEYHVAGHVYPAPHTTPEALELARILNEALGLGATDAVMEVSSHALAQERVFGVPFDVAVFTNLTRDHLDYHGTMEQYRGAKLRLADRVASDGVLSLNADDPAWTPLRADRRALAWGTAADADVTVADTIYRASGTRFTLGGRFGTRDTSIPFLGEFNVANAASAATVALGLGMPLDDVVERLATAPQVPGRMERLADAPFTVLRDYAHTPDAFERVLAMLRPLVPGRLFILFGCGGERDTGKRPIMGRIAAERADRVILTSDNPRHEDPEKIIDDIVVEMPADSYDRILDREDAIAHVLRMARPGDTVLLAGKGHETYQVEGSTHRYFDERAIVRSLLQ